MFYLFYFGKNDWLVFFYRRTTIWGIVLIAHFRHILFVLNCSYWKEFTKPDFNSGFLCEVHRVSGRNFSCVFLSMLRIYSQWFQHFVFQCHKRSIRNYLYRSKNILTSNYSQTRSNKDDSTITLVHIIQIISQTNHSFSVWNCYTYSVIPSANMNHVFYEFCITYHLKLKVKIGSTVILSCLLNITVETNQRFSF